MSKAGFVLMAPLALGLSACAGTGGTHPDSASKTSLTSHDIDTGKVAIVNRWAFDHGAKLIWVNYPQKRLLGDDDRGH